MIRECAAFRQRKKSLQTRLMMDYGILKDRQVIYIRRYCRCNAGIQDGVRDIMQSEGLVAFASVHCLVGGGRGPVGPYSVGDG